MINIIKRLFNYPLKLRLATFLKYKWRLKKCGDGVIIRKPLIFTLRCVSLGRCVYIMPNSRIEGVFEYGGKLFKPSIVIATGVTIQQNLHLTCAKSIIIGENTAIAANVTITDINHTYTNIHKSIDSQPIDVYPVSIGMDCKIYNNAVILPGTTIGKHCIIGAGSVVSGIIPDFCVVVGSPCRIVKKYNFKTHLWEKIDSNRNMYLTLTD